MGLLKDINNLEHEKFIESTSDPTKIGLVVLNPDGSDVGGSGGTVTIQETPPTDITKMNPAMSLSNDDEVATSNRIVTMTINGIPYQKELNFNNAGDFLSASPWVEM